MTPRVSVLLTTWNRPVMLAEAVESVMAQTFTGWELIVLDDCSDDPGVPAVLAQWWADPRVIVHKAAVEPGTRHRRVRYAVLANTGLALARGEYVTYLCDDDLYMPRRLEALSERLDAGDCQVVYGSQLVTRGAAEEFLRPAQGVLEKASMIVDHSSVMHTAQAARDAGGWDEDPAHWFHADAMFWDRLTAAGHAFHPVPEITDVHRFHDGSVSARGVPLP